MTRQRDNYRYLRSFLRHYRDLGVDRFVMIDEGSTDGSLPFLAQQSDVIILSAATSFAQSCRGQNWLNAVLMELPERQKLVLVDNDEYLVFSDGSQKLPTLFAKMARLGMDRLCTLMIDMYPAAPVSAAVFDGASDTLPWEVAPLFDSHGYDLTIMSRGPRWTGGVRGRLFDQRPTLNKYAVIFNPKAAIFDGTIHFPQPVTHNKGPIAGALLHFNYFSDFVEEHQRMVERGVHFQGARYYSDVLQKLGALDDAMAFDFAGEPTRVYTGPAQLCEMGLMADILPAEPGR